MKRTSIKNCLALAILLLAGVAGFAQSNGVPGPEDYASFSRFVSDRNIFDPSRQPHDYNTRRTYRPTRARSRGTPGIQLVGTMTYEKGMFAFFSGNNTDLSKVLQSGEKIVGYTITTITPDSVGLESADKKEQLELKIGDGFRQENNKWVFSKAGEIPAETSSTTETATPSNSDSTSASPATPPPSAGVQNDVLRRLMEKREKENQ